MIKKNINKLKI